MAVDYISRARRGPVLRSSGLTARALTRTVALVAATTTLRRNRLICLVGSLVLIAPALLPVSAMVLCIHDDGEQALTLGKSVNHADVAHAHDHEDHAHHSHDGHDHADHEAEVSEHQSGLLDHDHGCTDRELETDLVPNAPRLLVPGPTVSHIDLGWAVATSLKSGSVRLTANQRGPPRPDHVRLRTIILTI